LLEFVTFLEGTGFEEVFLEGACEDVWFFGLASGLIAYTCGDVRFLAGGRVAFFDAVLTFFGEDAFLEGVYTFWGLVVTF
jgi:hypothetical protein